MIGYKCCKCGNMTLGEGRVLAPKLVIGDTRSNFAHLKNNEMGTTGILCETCFHVLATMGAVNRNGCKEN